MRGNKKRARKLRIKMTLRCGVVWCGVVRCGVL